MANFYLAFDLDLAVVPVLNKIDLPAADPERVAADIESAFDLPAETTVCASAKSGIGIDEVLAAVVERVPPPTSYSGAAVPFRLLLFDAKADEFRGIVCMVLVKDGVVRKGDRLKAMSTGACYDVLEVCGCGPVSPAISPVTVHPHVVGPCRESMFVRVSGVSVSARTTGAEAQERRLMKAGFRNSTSRQVVVDDG